jgi:hypothetical protein
LVFITLIMGEEVLWKNRLHEKASRELVSRF